MSGELDVSVLRQTLLDKGPVTGETLVAGAKQVNVRVSPYSLALIRKTAAEMGLDVGEVIRRALAAYITAWRQHRRAELERVRGLSESLAAEWRVIVAQLPAGEMTENEPLQFSADAGNHVWARLERDPGVLYTLHEKFFAWKVDLSRKKITVFRNGHVAAEQPLPDGVLP